MAKNNSELLAYLKDVHYEATIRSPISAYNVSDLKKEALSSKSSFVLLLGDDEHGFSQWVK